MNIRTNIALAMLATLTLGSAQAATESYNYTLSNQLANDQASFVDLQLFDPAKGKLTSVTFTLVSTLQGEGGIENLQAKKSITFDLTLDGSVSLELPDVGLLAAATGQLLHDNFTVAKFDSTRDLLGASAKSFSYAATLSASNSFGDTAHLDQFTGTSTIRLPFLATVESTITGTSNRYDEFTTSASSSLQVVYSYDLRPGDIAASVPEPETWALMLAGVGVLASLSRRRRGPR